MVFNICVKFHENMSSGFKVMEVTRKLFTDTHTHTQRKDKNTIPPRHSLYAGGIIIPVNPSYLIDKVKRSYDSNIKILLLPEFSPFYTPYTGIKAKTKNLGL